MLLRKRSSFIFKHIKNDLNKRPYKKFRSLGEGNAELVGARGHNMFVKKTIYCTKIRTNEAVENDTSIPRCKIVSFLFRKTAHELKKCGEHLII